MEKVITLKDYMKAAMQQFINDNDVLDLSDNNLDDLIGESYTFEGEEFMEAVDVNFREMFDEETQYEVSLGSISVDKNDDWTINAITESHWKDEDNYNANPVVLLIFIQQPVENEMINRATYLAGDLTIKEETNE